MKEYRDGTGKRTNDDTRLVALLGNHSISKEPRHMRTPENAIVIHSSAPRPHLRPVRFAPVMYAALKDAVYDRARTNPIAHGR